MAATDVAQALAALEGALPRAEGEVEPDKQIYRVMSALIAFVRRRGDVLAPVGELRDSSPELGLPANAEGWRYLLEEHLLDWQPETQSLKVSGNLEREWSSRYGALASEALTPQGKGQREAGDNVAALVDFPALAVYSESIWQLGQAHRLLSTGRQVSDWRLSAALCMSALRVLAQQIYEPKHSEFLEQPALPERETSQQLLHTVEALAPGSRCHRLVEGVLRWNEHVLQKRDATVDDAKRCVLYSYMAIAEIAKLLSPPKN